MFWLISPNPNPNPKAGDEGALKNPKGSNEERLESNSIQKLPSPPPIQQKKKPCQLSFASKFFESWKKKSEPERFHQSLVNFPPKTSRAKSKFRHPNIKRHAFPKDPISHFPPKTSSAKSKFRHPHIKRYRLPQHPNIKRPGLPPYPNPNPIVGTYI